MTSTLTKAKETVARRSRLEIVDEAISADEAKLATGPSAVRRTGRGRGRRPCARRSAAIRAPTRMGCASRRRWLVRRPRRSSGRSAGSSAGSKRFEQTASWPPPNRLRAWLPPHGPRRPRSSCSRSARHAWPLPRRVDAGREVERARRRPGARRARSLGSVAGEQLIERVGISRSQRRPPRGRTNAGYIVTPVATTFAAFVDELLEAATADRVDVEAEYAEIDAQNERRRELAERDPGGRDDHPMIPYPVIPTEPARRCPRLPDLRDEVAQAEVLGRRDAAEPARPRGLLTCPRSGRRSRLASVATRGRRSLPRAGG